VVKNLLIRCGNEQIKKAPLHRLIYFLKIKLNFKIESLYINFISGTSIQEINKKFLKHDFSTDILTFNYSGNNAILDGEILISSKDAETNSKKYGVTFQEEISRLVIHGILHLIGYNDINPEQKLEMSRLEDKLLAGYKNVLHKKYVKR
jgi:rRNA maturation RNase YbeY